MHDTLQKDRPKLMVGERWSKGCGMVVKRLLEGLQTEPLFCPRSDLSRRLRDGVFASFSSGDDDRLCRHILPRAH
jgi:hypothetical protein